jgi:hypothetical protein
VLNDDGLKEAVREREEREMENFLLIFEFDEELQYSANLLSTVAPHHFAESFVEAAGDEFCLFGSTIKPKGSIVEPTVNALSNWDFSLQTKYKISRLKLKSLIGLR